MSELFVLEGLGAENSDWDTYGTLNEKTSDIESSPLLVVLRGVAPMRLTLAGGGDRRSVLTELHGVGVSGCRDERKRSRRI